MGVVAAAALHGIVADDCSKHNVCVHVQWAHKALRCSGLDCEVTQ